MTVYFVRERAVVDSFFYTGSRICNVFSCVKVFIPVD